MITIPARFQQKHPFPYPPDNHLIFEEWAATTMGDFVCDREYLRIFWTGYLVRANFGQDSRKIADLQDFINNLDKNKKYWTIIQYDSGPVVDFGGIDIKVFGMSGPKIDYPIPLLCPAHEFNFITKRDYKANFIGRDTHPIRTELIRTIGIDPDYYISLKSHPLKQYCEALARSVFTLCPRGFGQSSFRIAEAMQYGSIPVYISDEFILPYNNDEFIEYGVIVKNNDISQIKEILDDISPEEIKKKQEKIAQIYDTHFTYEGCLKKIMDELRLG